MKLKKARVVRFLALTLVLLLAASCTARTGTVDDLPTQKSGGEGRIPLTMSLKYSVNLDAFEQAVEERFPEVDLIQVGNYTGNYSDEYAEQLKNDDLTDIVLTWPLDAAARDCGDRLIDLSGMEITSRYHLSMLDSISRNGALYYLPGPTQVRGILFNQTMFEEHGWSVPTNFEEFVSLCEEIEASGIRSLQLSFWNKEVLRYAFMGFGYSDSFGTLLSTQKLQQYNGGEGSIGDFAMPAFESFQRLVDAGIFQPEDLDVRYPIREQMLYDRQCAMVSDGISLIAAVGRTGNADTFALMPFFCPGDFGTWGQLIPTQYIGLNRHLTDQGNEKKYTLALQVMDFISTPEGQLALANGNTTMVSSLTDSEAPKATELRHMKATIEAGRCMVFPSFENVEGALYDALSGILKGELTREEAIAMVDRENRNPTPVAQSPVIGTAEETFSLAETGAYVADVLRGAAGTDFAFFLDNGKDGTYNARGVSAKLYQGDIRESDVTQRVLPVLQHGEKGYMNIVTMTGKNLIQALEYAMDGGNWFYYFSGLKMTYDPMAEPGSRIKTITDSQGGAIKPEQFYTVAVLEGSVEMKYITSLEVTQTLIKDLVISDIKAKGSIAPSKDGRLQYQ